MRLPDIHRHRAHQPRNVNDVHRERMGIQDRIALGVVGVVGTMYFAYFCLAMVLFPSLVPASRDLIFFISSAVMQLVFLPIIIVGQNLQSQHAELRAEEDFLINKKGEAEIAYLNRKFDLALAHLGLTEEMVAELLKEAQDDRH